MENKNSEVISALNSLVEINNDRVEGYERAVNETEDADLKSKFQMFASQSREYRTQLASLVREYGGEPVEGTTTSGKFYRAWMDIKAALSGKDRKAIVSSCEYGEDVAKDTYKEVLEDLKTMPDNVRSVVVRQLSEIQRAHDEIKMMREMEK